MSKNKLTKLKDSELKAILAEVETEIGALLKAETDKLAKAEGDDESAGEESPAAESGPPAEGSESASASPAMDPPAAEEPGAQPGEEQSVPPGQDDPMADASAGGDPGMGAVDPEALKQEFSQYDDETLKAVYMAAKAELFERMAGGAGAAPPGADPSAAAAPPPPSPSASASAPPAGPPMMGKGEMEDPVANGGLDKKKGGLDDIKHDVQKSEKSGEVTELKAQVELLTKAVELALTTPMRKAITSVSQLPAKEPQKDVKSLSKAEVMEQLREVTRDPKLSKRDRDLVNQYCVNGINVEKIAHLLK
jgi:hypothetical protein